MYEEQKAMPNDTIVPSFFFSTCYFYNINFMEGEDKKLII